MSGYTPIFSTVLDGTLYGRWPHTGIWMCVLSQCDRNGNVDMVPGLLAAKIGVPLAMLLECIADFMKPDPESRSGALDGRRLELIEPASREWGWHVVNHSLYRERARKQAYDNKRTSSGADAERKRDLRHSRDVPTRPAKSRSQTHTQTQTANTNVGGERAAARPPAIRIPDDFELTEERREYARVRGVAPEPTFEAFLAYWRTKPKDNTKLDWNLTWHSWVLKDAKDVSQRDTPRKGRFDQVMEQRRANQ